MKTHTNVWAILLALTLAVQVHAQQAKNNTNGYVTPTDKHVLEKLDQWKDLKFGTLICWGLYSVEGMMESWTLCGEDEDWITRLRTKDLSYEAYKKWYWNQINDITLSKFNPDQWADVVEKAGMKYMIFTTKHHEGFCTFDTKQTDFNIMHSPFGNNPKANMTKEVFNSFRNKGFMIGAYYSKPDWHCEYYWWPYFSTPNRNVNYDVKKYPERWDKFCKFTFNQIEEITNGDYGDVDILWLDGGQVQPQIHQQDIHMDKIADMARGHQPGLIIVDRTVRGKHENYQTPEHVIPEKQLDIPWETCTTMNGWGWRKNGTYKPANYVIAQLIEIVAKGGNLLLGVGPTPEGIIDDIAIDRLTTIGEWLKRNGKGIYSTINAKHYNDGHVWFTQNKDKKTHYAFYALGNDEKEVPEVIEWTTNIPKYNKVTLLSNGKRVKCEVKGNKVTVYLPKGMKRTESIGFSFTIKENK